jgi:DNA-binding MarR family transcriptional regulator
MGALARPGSRDSGLTVKELIAFLMVSRQNLTAVIDRLVAAGLVERLRAGGDGRLRHVRLTEEGARQWASMGPAIRAYYQAALDDFSTEECVQLFRLLDRLRGSLNRIAEPE